MKKLLLALGVTALLAGCAANPLNASGVQPGTGRDAVVARLGQPTRVVRLPAGTERLQYSLQPFGQSAWMIDLDPAGRVVRSRQVLTAAEFNRIEVGTWTRGDVEREFGPPARIDGVASWNGPIMSYRWNDGSDMFYWVYLDARDRVQRAHPGMEFVNAPDRD
ncbi:MAG: membrane lipoprotein lipid attachment site-containing protein [Ramlibacter sp.]|nr:membrane lipoprotein lipid attachment site-containing protein [Ramlibacter sp.]